MEIALKKYIQLIEGFINRTILVHSFEKEYLQLVKNETFIFEEGTAKIIETLFSDTDAFCVDPTIANYNLNDPFSNINEEELRTRAKKALEQLRLK